MQINPQSRYLAAITIDGMPDPMDRGHAELMLIERRADGELAASDVTDEGIDPAFNSWFNGKRAVLFPISAAIAERMCVMGENAQQYAGRLFHFGLRNRIIPGQDVVAFPESLRQAHPAYAHTFRGRLKQGEQGLIRPETNCAHFAVQGARIFFDLPLERLHPKFRNVKNMLSFPAILKDFDAQLERMSFPIHSAMGDEGASTIIGKPAARALYMRFHEKPNLDRLEEDGLYRLKESMVDGIPLVDYVLDTVPEMKPSVARVR